jgi:hypothetical protein
MAWNQVYSNNVVKKPASLPARPPSPLAANPATFTSHPQTVTTNVAFTASAGVPQYYHHGYQSTTDAYTGLTTMSASENGTSNYQTSYYGQYDTNNYYQGNYDQYAPTPPQIQNPFTTPVGQTQGRDKAGQDAELDAQLAQWQSAYVTKDDGKGGANRASSGNLLQTPPTGTSTDQGADGKTTKKTAIRQGGGRTWTDDSLLEWNPEHPRIFVGNLAGEVTDDSLYKAFSKYSSLSKARVVRDKRTTKSKGYGFVSFASADDFFKAAREMNGKYIGSHPVMISKAKTEMTVAAPPSKNKYKNKSHQSTNGQEGHYGKDREGKSGPGSYAGIIKREGKKKEKAGLKLLG